MKQVYAAHVYRSAMYNAGVFSGAGIVIDEENDVIMFDIVPYNESIFLPVEHAQANAFGLAPYHTLLTLAPALDEFDSVPYRANLFDQ